MDNEAENQQPQSPPPVEQSPAPELDEKVTERRRPPHETSARWLLALLLLGAVPAAVVGWLDLREAGRVKESVGKLAEVLRRAQSDLEPARELDQKLRRQLGEKCSALQEKLFQLERDAAIAQVSGRLSRLMSGKSVEQISADAAIGKILEQAQPPLELVVLLDAEGGVLRAPSRLGQPEQEALKAELKAPEKGRWQLVQPADCPARVAMRVSAPEQFAPAPDSEPQPAWSVPQADEAGRFAARLEQRARLFLIGSAGAGLLLAGLLFLSLRRRMWRPLRQLADRAGQMLDKTGEDTVQPEAFAGPAAELSLSLQRIGERLALLESLQAEHTRRSEDLARMEESLRQAAAGDLGVRMPLPAGELQVLARAVNRLLEATAGAMESLSRSSARCAAVAEGLHRSAGSLAQRMDEPEKLADSSAVAQMLSVSLDSLYRLALESLKSDAPVVPSEQLKADDLSLLSERSAAVGELAGTVADESRRAEELARLAMLLHTQLSLLRDASPALEEPGRQARQLAEDIESMRASLQERTGRLVQLSQLTGRTAGQAAASLQDTIRLAQQAASWQHNLADKQRQILLQLEAILPLSRTLGDVFGRLYREAEQRGQKLGQQRQTLMRMTEMAEQLGELANSLHQEARRLGPSAPAPAVVSQELARSRQSLERVVRAMEEAARREGIEALAPETAELIERIREIADDARSRITQSQGDGPANAGATG